MQDGCGANFNFSSAPKYKRPKHDHLDDVDITKLDPEDMDRVKADHGEILKVGCCGRGAHS